jgi:hypothetical protein
MIRRETTGTRTKDTAKPLFCEDEFVFAGDAQQVALVAVHDFYGIPAIQQGLAVDPGRRFWLVGSVRWCAVFGGRRFHDDCK